jgi:hypothetical protein
MVIAPVTDSELVPLIVIPLAIEAALIEILAHTALELTVTVTPELIMTASEDVGTADPPHVVVLFQFPLTDAVFVAQKAASSTARKRNMIVAKQILYLRKFILMKNGSMKFIIDQRLDTEDQ